MTSTHWPYQHFELLSFLAHPNCIIYYKWQSDQTKNLYARAYRSMGWLRPCFARAKSSLSNLDTTSLWFLTSSVYTQIYSQY